MKIIRHTEYQEQIGNFILGRYFVSCLVSHVGAIHHSSLVPRFPSKNFWTTLLLPPLFFLILYPINFFISVNREAERPRTNHTTLFSSQPPFQTTNPSSIFSLSLPSIYLILKTLSSSLCFLCTDASSSPSPYTHHHRHSASPLTTITHIFRP